MTRRTRSELLRLFEPTLGTEAATALVEEIEVVDADRLATKADLAATGDELRREIAGARGELHHRIDLLEERLDGRFGRIDERFEAVHSAIGQAKNEVLAAYRGEITAAVSGQTRAIIFTMIGTVLSLGGLAIALAQLG